MQQGTGPPAPAMDVSPESLRVLVVESNTSARQAIVQLLKECSYQVMDVKGTAEALQLLKEQQARDGAPGVDLILKEHNPPAANACRLLTRTLEDDVLRTVPVVVTSPQEDRDVMVACLQLGAADYMIEPLRHNELRNLWARVYWWRRAFYLQQQATHVRGPKEHSPGSLKLHYYPNQSQLSSEKRKRLVEEQKQGDKDDAERSGEGSAPNSGGDGNEGSKDGNRNSNSREKLGSGSGIIEGNGNSATKQCQGSNQPNNESGINGNGNSATKALNPGNGNGNSGNDASTTSKEAAALRGTAEGGLSCARAELAEPANPQATLEHALDVMRSRSTSLKLEHTPASNNGSGRDSKQNVPNGSSEPTSGQEVGRVRGTGENLTGGDSSFLLKAASLQGTADGAELTAPLETRLPSQDGSGFRAYVQPTNDKRKASEVGNLASAPAAKQANHPMARAGALAATTKDGSGGASCATAWGMTSGSTPTSASEDTRIPASGGSGVGIAHRAVSNNPTEHGDWPTANMAARMQARMQHQQGTGQQLTPPQMGPFAGPGSFPYFGMPGPNFPMSNPFWPQMGSGMHGGNQGPRPPLYPGAGNNGQFDPVSAAYYASLGNQQMAAAMAAAANASGQSSVTGNNTNHQQQQQFASFMLQQQQQQHQMLLQQYNMAAAAQQLGQWSVNSNGADQSSPSNRQGFPCNTFGQQGSNQARSVQSFPPHQLAPQFVQQQRAAARKGPDAARQHYGQQGSLQVHSAPNGGAASKAPTKTANGATSRAPPMPQNNNNGAIAASVGHQAMRTAQQQQEGPQQQQQAPQQQPSQHKPSAEQEAADRKPAAAPEDAAAAGKERRAQALHKYKQKRKNLNFTKKIRYESRKQLAQARPRVKGQFVRMTPNGPELTTVDSDAQGEVDAAQTGSALGSAEALMALAAGDQAEEEALEQEEESDADVEPKAGANGNGTWQFAARALDEDDEDDAVNSPQDKCARATSLAPGNQSLSRLQQQGLPAHQQSGHGLIRVGSPMVPAGQPSKAGKIGNGSSDSGSNSPEIHAGAPAEPAAPQMVAP